MHGPFIDRTGFGRLLSALTGSLALCSVSAGQSFNVDTNVALSGPWAGAPSIAFAGAAGQPGHWVSLGVGPGASNIRDINDVVTTADIIITNSGGGYFHDHPSVSGDHELLMGDAQANSGGALTVTFTQLLNGVYTVFTYARHPEFTNLTTAVNVPNSIDPVQVVGGGSVGNFFALGDTHARHRVQTSNGSITITLASGYFAGVQLIYHGVPAAIMYVDGNASGTGQGNSWANACRRLEDALLVCEFSEGTANTVWVADGTYLPSRTNDRTESFRVVDGVKVYGGFAGGETQLAQRDPKVNICTLSGNIGNSLSHLDNAYHVVNLNNTGNTTVLDGCTITGGHANGPSTDEYGGGLIMMNSSARIRSCRIVDNDSGEQGAGAFASGGAPQFQRCLFMHNFAGGQGGAVLAANSASLMAFHNCRFIGNDAMLNGGAVAAFDQEVWFANCVFSGNFATLDGGAILAANDSAARLYACTVVNNAAGGFVGGVYALSGADGRAFNSIFWGNADGLGASSTAVEQFFVDTPGVYEASHNIIHGTTTPLNGNIGTNPLIIDADGADNLPGTEDDDLHVASNSPAIDSGNTTQIALDVTDLDGDGVTLELVPLDLDDLPRRVDIPSIVDSGIGPAPIIDRGAYEVQSIAPTCPADINNDGNVNVADLLGVIGAWGACATPPCAADVNGDNLINVADLLAVIGAWGPCP